MMNGDNGYGSENGKDEEEVKASSPYPGVVTLKDTYDQQSAETEVERLKAEAELEASKTAFLKAQIGEFDPTRLRVGDLVSTQGGIMGGQAPTFPAGLILAGVAAYFYFKKGRK